MKVLMINKFLYPNGGSETYIFKLGQALQAVGHEVQYFGMYHKDNCVSNGANVYTEEMDFHTASKLKKITYSLRTVYSVEARKKIWLLLNQFQPDVCHLNNFNYQLTPSIILEIVKWREKNNKKCKIIYTAHDYQLICPNHQLYNPVTGKNCEKCLGGKFHHCLKDKCIHGSTVKSAVGMFEAYFWKWKGTYQYIDTIICCSEFLKKKMDTNMLLMDRTVAMHNFVEKAEEKHIKKKDYVLYFGRFSQEKGFRTIVEAAKCLSDIPFVFAGSGPLEQLIYGIPNIKNVGFQTGENLENLIREARFSVYPSEWYENCPFSVMESQIYGTPVLGADIGGISELIKNEGTGELFQSGNSEELQKKIRDMWKDESKIERYRKNCQKNNFITVDEYVRKLMQFYS